MDAKTYIRLTLLMVGLTQGLSLHPAWADTFTVTKFTDEYDGKCDKDCSLRDAIQEANKSAQPSVIKLEAGTYRQSIQGEDNKNQSGDWDVSGNILLQGAGPEKTMIHLGGNNRAFEVLPNASLSLEGLTLTGGHSNYGGAIRNRGTLTLKNCALVENVADISGGAIYNDKAGRLTVMNTSFQKNVASQGNGGAIEEAGQGAEVTNSIFTQNRAMKGGCLDFVQGATLLSIISGSENSAVEQGGCLWTGGSKEVTIKEISVSNNKAPVGKDCLGILVNIGRKIDIGEPNGCQILTSKQPTKSPATPPAKPATPKKVRSQQQAGTKITQPKTTVDKNKSRAGSREKR